MLAIALFIERYTKKEMSKSKISDLEHKWLGRWKEKLGMPARTPHQVMQIYCDMNNITPEFLDLAMDWECWPESDHADECLGSGHTGCIRFDHIPSIPAILRTSIAHVPTIAPATPVPDPPEPTTVTTFPDATAFINRPPA
jgi:hypothetical protein